MLSPKIVPGLLQNSSKAAHSGGSSKPLQDGVVVVNVLDVPVVVVLVNVVEVVVMHVPQRTGHRARDAAPKITLLQTVALVLQSAGSAIPLHTSVVVVVAVPVVVVELAVDVVELTVVEVVLESVVDVVVKVVDETDVVVVVVELDVEIHALHNAGQCWRILVPTKLPKTQEETMYGSSLPHSLGSARPLQSGVVVVVVAVTVVTVVESTQESQAIGQRGGRSGNASHCVDVTPLQSSGESGVRCGFAPLQSSHLGPDQGKLQSQVYVLLTPSLQVPWFEHVTPATPGQSPVATSARLWRFPNFKVRVCNRATLAAAVASIAAANTRAKADKTILFKKVLYVICWGTCTRHLFHCMKEGKGKKK